jgi:hypothetical protein
MKLHTVCDVKTLVFLEGGKNEKVSFAHIGSDVGSAAEPHWDVGVSTVE